MSKVNSTAERETVAQPSLGPWHIHATSRIARIHSGLKPPAYDTEVAVVFETSSRSVANARLIAAAPDYKALVDRAVAVLQRHAPPDGLSDHDAMSELYGIFDGPEYRAAVQKAEGRL